MLYLNYIQELIKTAVDAIKGVTDILPDAGALTSIAQESTLGNPVGTDLSADIAAIKAVVDGIAGSESIVRKTVTFSNTGASTIALFTVSQAVSIILHARCKTSCVSVAGANIRLGIVGSDAVFIADTLTADLVAGEIWNDISPTTKIEKVLDATFQYDLGNGDDIQIVLDAQVDSGVLEFMVEFKKISSDGNVVAT